MTGGSGAGVPCGGAVGRRLALAIVPGIPHPARRTSAMPLAVSASLAVKPLMILLPSGRPTDGAPRPRPLWPEWRQQGRLLRWCGTRRAALEAADQARVATTSWHLPATASSLAPAVHAPAPHRAGPPAPSPTQT